MRKTVYFLWCHRILSKKQKYKYWNLSINSDIMIKKEGDLRKMAYYLIDILNGVEFPELCLATDL